MPVGWLIDKMKKWNDTPAIIWNGRIYKYRDLLERIAFWEEKLSQKDIKCGNVVGIEGDYSPNVCAILLALINKRAIIVPMAGAMKAHREEFLKTAEVQFNYVFDEKDESRLERHFRKVQNPVSRRLIEMYEPGLVLFSSGSTGRPKAVLHNFTCFLERFKVPRRRMCCINFLMFDHIGGVNTLFYNLSSGGTVVTTKNRRPEEICKLIEKYNVELLPTTPTFLNLLLISEAYRNYDLSSLNLITYGTEVMSESVLKRLNTVFPNVKFLQTYGMSEFGIPRSKSRNSESLWMRIGGEGFETKVVDGVLWVRARSAMIGYLNAPNPFTDDGWLITEDVVEVDGDYMRILGRKSEIINVGGEKVYPAEVESVLIMMSGVEEVVVSGEANPILGQLVKAKIKVSTVENRREFLKRMCEFCRDKLPRYKIPQKVEIVTDDLHGSRFKRIRG